MLWQIHCATVRGSVAQGLNIMLKTIMAALISVGKEHQLLVYIHRNRCSF